MTKKWYNQMVDNVLVTASATASSAGHLSTFQDRARYADQKAMNPAPMAWIFAY